MCKLQLPRRMGIVAQAFNSSVFLIFGQTDCTTYRLPLVIMVPAVKTIRSLPSDGFLCGVQRRLRLCAVDVCIRWRDIECFTYALRKWLSAMCRRILLIGPDKRIRAEVLQRHADSVCEVRPRMPQDPPTSNPAMGMGSRSISTFSKGL